MIKVDESDPVGELEPSFPYKEITIRRGVDMKEHYELQSEIGRGKFGTVFKCREKETGLMLAAKFVGIVHKQDRRNVEREVEIMRELQHPRLIQLYDAFEANNAMCFILELVEGGELFERVIGDDFILTEKAVTIFMRQICEGVQFIHSKNILHLDLKPENILCLTKTGNRIKIIDFGLARKFNPENKLQVLFGTPEFVAPEVVNFDGIGFGTDMWSVGVICYVLLSGLSPFMGETDVETMANVTIAQYDFDDEAFDSISNDAKDFIKKLLLKDHKSRPTATECLSHRWLQKKKPKKMVRKNSSKKLAKQTEGKTKPVVADVVVQNELLSSWPLDASKENLKELCSKSRSQSPVEIATVLPNLAQLRIQKDCNNRLFKAGNNNVTQMAETAGNKSPPKESIENCNRLLVTSGIPAVTLSDMTPANVSVKSEMPPVLSVVTPVLPEDNPVIPAVTPVLPSVTPVLPSVTPVLPAVTPMLPVTSELPTIQHVLTTSLTQPATPQLPTTSTNLDVRNVTPSSPAIDIPSRGQLSDGQPTNTWSQTSLTTNHNYRRASDVSYMFSSFRTTTVSSNFLGSDLQDLSDRLQDLKTMFDNREYPVQDVGGNLHRLLLNRQHLTAATADRKPKFKLTPMNRDVPVGSPPPASNLLYYMTTTSSSSKTACRSEPHSKQTSPEHESSTAKEMFLKLFYGSGKSSSNVGDKTAEPELST